MSFFVVTTGCSLGVNTATTWVTDMRHYLDEAGRTADMSATARNLADHLGAIVMAITGQPWGRGARRPRDAGAARETTVSKGDDGLSRGRLATHPLALRGMRRP